MQNDNILIAVLMLLLGGGGVGGIGLAVNAWRAHRKGKIEDDGTLIERLNAENRELAAKNATHQRFEQLWMTQAFRYRRQVVRDSDVDPDDMKELWDANTPKVIEQ